MCGRAHHSGSEVRGLPRPAPCHIADDGASVHQPSPPTCMRLPTAGPFDCGPGPRTMDSGRRGRSLSSRDSVSFLVETIPSAQPPQLISARHTLHSNRNFLQVLKFSFQSFKNHS